MEAEVPAVTAQLSYKKNSNFSNEFRLICSIASCDSFPRCKMSVQVGANRAF